MTTDYRQPEEHQSVPTETVPSGPLLLGPAHGSATCDWTHDENGPDETQCGHAFEFTYDGVKENDFKFCPFCGGAIVVKEKLCDHDWEEKHDDAGEVDGIPGDHWSWRECRVCGEIEAPNEKVS